MKIYTKTGDKGETGLFNGQRVEKFNPRVELYGTVDELNSVIGIACASKPGEPLLSDLCKVSKTLFSLGTDLATPRDPEPKFPVKRMDESSIDWLENKIDEYTAGLPKLTKFILPGGGRAAAHLHHARTICRRAERLAVKLSATQDIGSIPVKYLNRLSDYFFTAARFANKLEGLEDVTVDI